MIEHFKWRKAEDELPTGTRAVLVRHGIDNRITSICTWNGFTWIWETVYDYSNDWTGDRYIPFDGTEWCYIQLPGQSFSWYETFGANAEMPPNGVAVLTFNAKWQSLALNVYDKRNNEWVSGMLEATDPEDVTHWAYLDISNEEYETLRQGYESWRVTKKDG